MPGQFLVPLPQLVPLGDQIAVRLHQHRPLFLETVDVTAPLTLSFA